MGFLLKRDANDGGRLLWGGIELPGFYSVHRRVDEQRMPADGLDGCDFARSRNCNFQLYRTLEVHPLGSFGKAGADVVVNVA